MISERLTAYQKRMSQLPERLIIFRNNVSKVNYVTTTNYHLNVLIGSTRVNAKLSYRARFLASSRPLRDSASKDRKFSIALKSRSLLVVDLTTQRSGRLRKVTWQRAGILFQARSWTKV